MSEVDQSKLERALDSLAARSKPGDLEQLSRQFETRLRVLEERGDAPEGMTDDLRLFWRMLQAPELTVPWRSKALIMAAISYFVSPLDLLPDMLGEVGHFDDAMVLRMVKRRVAAAVERFEASEEE